MAPAGAEATRIQAAAMEHKASALRMGPPFGPNPCLPTAKRTEGANRQVCDEAAMAALALAFARALPIDRMASQATANTIWAPTITLVTSTAGFHSQSPSRRTNAPTGRAESPKPVPPPVPCGESPDPPPAPPRTTAAGMIVTPFRSYGSPNTRCTVRASRAPEITFSTSMAPTSSSEPIARSRSCSPELFHQRGHVRVVADDGDPAVPDGQDLDRPDVDRPARGGDLTGRSQERAAMPPTKPELHHHLIPRDDLVRDLLLHVGERCGERLHEASEAFPTGQRLSGGHPGDVDVVGAQVQGGIEVPSVPQLVHPPHHCEGIVHLRLGDLLARVHERHRDHGGVPVAVRGGHPQRRPLGRERHRDPGEGDVPLEPR